MHYTFKSITRNTFTNTQRSESTMSNNFEEKFGSPKETVVIAGDYDNGGCHMKGKQPTTNKRLLGNCEKLDMMSI
jgi:hypothetical protein